MKVFRVEGWRDRKGGGLGGMWLRGEAWKGVSDEGRGGGFNRDEEYAVVNIAKSTCSSLDSR